MLSTCSTRYDVVHVPEIASDHCSVFCIVDTGHIPFDKGPAIKPSPAKPKLKKPSSERKNLNESNLEASLSMIVLPESLQKCKDVLLTTQPTVIMLMM